MNSLLKTRKFFFTSPFPKVLDNLHSLLNFKNLINKESKIWIEIIKTKKSLSFYSESIHPITFLSLSSYFINSLNLSLLPLSLWKEEFLSQIYFDEFNQKIINDINFFSWGSRQSKSLSFLDYQNNKISTQQNQTLSSIINQGVDLIINQKLIDNHQIPFDPSFDAHIEYFRIHYLKDTDFIQHYTKIFKQLESISKNFLSSKIPPAKRRFTITITGPAGSGKSIFVNKILTPFLNFNLIPWGGLKDKYKTFFQNDEMIHIEDMGIKGFDFKVFQSLSDFNGLTLERKKTVNVKYGAQNLSKLKALIFTNTNHIFHWVDNSKIITFQDLSQVLRRTFASFHIFQIMSFSQEISEKNYLNRIFWIGNVRDFFLKTIIKTNPKIKSMRLSYYLIDEIDPQNLSTFLSTAFNNLLNFLFNNQDYWASFFSVSDLPKNECSYHPLETELPPNLIRKFHLPKTSLLMLILSKAIVKFPMLGLNFTITSQPKFKIANKSTTPKKIIKSPSFSIKFFPALPLPASSFSSALNFIKTNQTLVLDTETLTLNKKLKRNVFSYLPLRIITINSFVLLWTKLSQFEKSQLQSLLINKTIIVHNLAFELERLHQHGFNVNDNKFIDTSLLARFSNNQLYSENGRDSLAYLENQLLNSNQKTNLIDLLTQKHGKDFYDKEEIIFDKDFIKYCLTDTEITWKLYQCLKSNITPLFLRLQAYDYQSWKFQRQGINISESNFKNQNHFLISKATKLLSTLPVLNKLKPWNGWLSTFEQDIWIKTNRHNWLSQSFASFTDKKQQFRFDSSAREKLLKLYPSDNILINSNQLISTLKLLINLESFQKWIVDGKIFPQLKLLGTQTGRFTSSKPAIHNTKKSKTIFSIKQLIFSSPGTYSLDFINQELRTAAFLSNDKLLEQEVRSDDIHTKTAQKFKITRDQAKSINFAIMYGIGVNSLSEKLNLPLLITKNLIKNFWKSYPSLSNFKSRLTNFINTKTLKRRIFFNKNSSYKNLNYAIQGEGADLIILITEYIFNNQLQFKLLSHRHDEIIIQCFSCKTHSQLSLTPFCKPVLLLKSELEKLIPHKWSDGEKVYKLSIKI